jgi:hypothetical protein
MPKWYGLQGLIIIIIMRSTNLIALNAKLLLLQAHQFCIRPDL